MQGKIIRGIAGCYYVHVAGSGIYECKAKGIFRKENKKPLVGDNVEIDVLDERDREGNLVRILPRKNELVRPAVANVDQLVIIVSQAVPATDPFLIDRVISIAERRGCDSVICVNKWDLVPGEDLYQIYTSAGFTTLKVSAETGEGIEELRQVISGKVSAFTGNSGVGKSSILNALEPGIALQTGEISEKLGRGRHTTRHVELIRLSCGAMVADTPGFSSFDTERMELCRKEELAGRFREFAPYRDRCQFQDCAHLKEKGCAVLAAVKAGEIPKSRHDSYVRLYEQAKQIPDWEQHK